MLFSSKNEWNVDTCCDIAEPQKPYAKWKKPNTHTHKKHLLYNFIYMKCPE